MRKIAPVSLSASVSSHSSSSQSHTSSSSRTWRSSAPVTLNPTQLTELAEAFELCADVQNRKCKKTKKKFQQVFLGNEAVEILQQLARLDSRQDALQVGRFLQQSLNLFHCVNCPRVFQLEDSPLLFYQFVKKPKKKKVALKNPDQLMRLLQKKVVVRDRDYLVTNYRQCFVGKEAVDVMMICRMAKTREECVEIGRVFMNQYNLFVPVTATGFALDFEDDAYKFYRFTEQKIQEKALTFIEEIKPASWLISSFLVPACIAYYYFY